VIRKGLREDRGNPELEGIQVGKRRKNTVGGQVGEFQSRTKGRPIPLNHYQDKRMRGRLDDNARVGGRGRRVLYQC